MQLSSIFVGRYCIAISETRSTHAAGRDHCLSRRLFPLQAETPCPAPDLKPPPDACRRMSFTFPDLLSKCKFVCDQTTFPRMQNKSSAWCACSGSAAWRTPLNYHDLIPVLVMHCHVEHTLPKINIRSLSLASLMDPQQTSLQNKPYGLSNKGGRRCIRRCIRRSIRRSIRRFNLAS